MHAAKEMRGIKESVPSRECCFTASSQSCKTPAWDQWAKAAPSELTEKSSNPGLILTRDLLRNKFLRAAIG